MSLTTAEAPASLLTPALPLPAAQPAVAAPPAPSAPPAVAKTPEPKLPAGDEDFFPLEPKTLEATGLTEREIESLVLKFLLQVGACEGRQLAERLRLPFFPLAEFVGKLKRERLVNYKAAAAVSDYVYELTDIGQERARRYSQVSTYFGAAPVPLADYIASVSAQSLSRKKPNLGDLCRAFSDLVLSRELLVQLGQAVHSGRGMFLYGSPGNGKTSIAERVTRAFGEAIWIPRTISVWGEIVRLYDPSVHDALPLAEQKEGYISQRTVDQRWIRIKRPTLVVGGELTLAQLEMITNPATGINEAPLQLKSNCGTLVIDDFGRQRCSPVELLNRWIVPLEKRFDFLNLASGVKIQVPFDQLVVFSTNLEPRDLVDEAFFRRIPYKIQMHDPSEQEFRMLVAALGKHLGVECPQPMVDYLIARHYREANRALRFCHPRDLLLQVKHFCSLHGIPSRMTQEAVDAAAKNYFSTL